MGQSSRAIPREGLEMLSVVAVLLSLTVCQALYVSPVQPMFHHVPLWVVRAVPGLPTSPVVLELPTEQEFVPRTGRSQTWTEPAGATTIATAEMFGRSTAVRASSLTAALVSVTGSPRLTTTATGVRTPWP